MAKVYRSSITGKFVKPSTAARHPAITIRQTVPSRASGNRSSISGRFISNAGVARHPKTSVKHR